MVLDGTGSVYDDTGWYLVSISWYCLVLGGTWSAKGLYACIYWKKWRFGRVTPMPDSQTTEYSATQLVESIKFKLSHAISWGYQSTDRNRLISLSLALNVIHTQITKGSVNIQIPLEIIKLSKNLSAHFLCFMSIILFLSVV